MMNMILGVQVITTIIQQALAQTALKEMFIPFYKAWELKDYKVFQVISFIRVLDFGPKGMNGTDSSTQSTSTTANGTTIFDQVNS